MTSSSRGETNHQKRTKFCLKQKKSHKTMYQTKTMLKQLLTCDQGPVSERRLSENSEYVNPEMRETLGFPLQNGRFVKPGKAG